MNTSVEHASPKVVFFDFGGVLADEGFRNGLYSIASKNGIDKDEFESFARHAIYSTGYLIGQADETAYWDHLRNEKKIAGSDEELRKTVLSGFVLRQWMFDIVENLSSRNVRVAILSDQTNWLDELDGSLAFFNKFEHVFNSFHLGKSKYDASIFDDVLAVMGVRPEDALFVDDTMDHVKRARGRGLNAIHFTVESDFLKEFSFYFDDLPD